VDRGILAGSVAYSIEQDSEGVYLRVGSTMEKVKGGSIPVWLEYGTSKMKPRPAFRPGYLNTRTRVAKIFTAGVGVRSVVLSES
jgi:hypothetical protein